MLENNNESYEPVINNFEDKQEISEEIVVDQDSYEPCGEVCMLNSETGNCENNDIVEDEISYEPQNESSEVRERKLHLPEFSNHVPSLFSFLTNFSFLNPLSENESENNSETNSENDSNQNSNENSSLFNEFSCTNCTKNEDVTDLIKGAKIVIRFINKNFNLPVKINENIIVELLSLACKCSENSKIMKIAEEMIMKKFGFIEIIFGESSNIISLLAKLLYAILKVIEKQDGKHTMKAFVKNPVNMILDSIFNKTTKMSHTEIDHDRNFKISSSPLLNPSTITHIGTFLTFFLLKLNIIDGTPEIWKSITDRLNLN